MFAKGRRWFRLEKGEKRLETQQNGRKRREMFAKGENGFDWNVHSTLGTLRNGRKRLETQQNGRKRREMFAKGRKWFRLERTFYFGKR